MDVSALTGGSTTGASSSRNQLAEDLNTFLTLLTSQLQNQDPLSPMDSTEFTNQLVLFAQVEQQIGMNENLEKVLNQGKQTNAALAVSYLGQQVEAESDTLPLQGGFGKFAYGLSEESYSTTILIKDSTGKVVHTIAGETAAGVHAAEWDGKDANGQTQPDGLYSIEITALAKDVTSVAAYTTVFGKVTGVTTSTDGTILLSLDGVGVPLDAVLSVTPPASADAGAGG